MRRENEDQLDLIMKENRGIRSRLLALQSKMSQWNEENKEIVKMHIVRSLLDTADSAKLKSAQREKMKGPGE